MIRAFVISLILATAAIAAAPRTWKSADGSQSFQGAFVERAGNQITFLRSDGQKMSLDLAKLHLDDQLWIQNHHPAKNPSADDAPDPAAIFDNLKFGDSRETVQDKLRVSKVVEPIARETVFGSSGPKGIYRTRHQIGGLQAQISFDWTDDGSLREITLQTESVTSSAPQSDLSPAWGELIELLTTLHGKPLQAGAFPNLANLPPGTLLGSHRWNLENQGTALLGVARQTDTYTVVVRFTQGAPKRVVTSP
jgi:hypothetical protein